MTDTSSMDAAAKPKKTCDHPGCTRKRVSGAYCKKHLGDADAVESVMRLTEIEALKFNRIDVEIRNSLQGQRLADFEIDKAERDAQDLKRLKMLEKARLQAIVERMKPEYEALVKSIAEKFNLDPTTMTIDPDTRVIRGQAPKKE
jgi:hypothetical protein